MSDFSDTSYYEIALTNRQVVVAFVILLTMVLAVFLCGVWVGQNGKQRLVQTDGVSGPASEPEELANLEEFKFFEDQAKKEELDKPDLGALLDNPRRDTTLAQDVGSGAPAKQPESRQQQASEAATQTPAQQRRPEPQAATPPPSAPPQQAAPPPPAPTRQAPPPSAPPRETQQAAPTSPVPATDSFVVQVFSTHDEPQARKLLKRLEGLGHRAFLSTIDVGGQTMFRVRVGPFSERGAADRVKGQVRNQLKLDPWVTAASN